MERAPRSASSSTYEDFSMLSRGSERLEEKRISDMYSVASDSEFEERSTASRNSKRSLRSTNPKRAKSSKSKLKLGGKKNSFKRDARLLSSSKQLFILLILWLMVFANSLAFLTFGDTNSSCYDHFYQVSEPVGYLVLVPTVMYLPGTVLSYFLAGYSLENGAKLSLVVGGFLSVLGAGFKLLSLVVPRKSLMGF